MPDRGPLPTQRKRFLIVAERYERLLKNARWPASQEAARRAVHHLTKAIREAEGDL